jgi:hypothetical protein
VDTDSRVGRTDAFPEPLSLNTQHFLVGVTKQACYSNKFSSIYQGLQHKVQSGVVGHNHNLRTGAAEAGGLRV